MDEKPGLDKCRGFSPLLTFLSVLSGSGRPFAESAKILSKALGFPISATAVQSNSESAGEQLDDDPGMRWKKADNFKILRARLASLNGYLERHYRPTPRFYSFRPDSQEAA